MQVLQGQQAASSLTVIDEASLTRIALLGSGKFGKVWLASLADIDERVVVKVSKQRNVSGQEYRELMVYACCYIPLLAVACCWYGWFEGE